MLNTINSCDWSTHLCLCVLRFWHAPTPANGQPRALRFRNITSPNLSPIFTCNNVHISTTPKITVMCMYVTTDGVWIGLVSGFVDHLYKGLHTLQITTH